MYNFIVIASLSRVSIAVAFVGIRLCLRVNGWYKYMHALTMSIYNFAYALFLVEIFITRFLWRSLYARCSRWLSTYAIRTELTKLQTLHSTRFVALVIYFDSRKKREKKKPALLQRSDFLRFREWSGKWANAAVSVKNRLSCEKEQKKKTANVELWISSFEW